MNEAMRSVLADVRQTMSAQVLKRSPQENKFLLLIPVIGLLTGVAAVLIAHLMAFLQSRVFWWDAGHILDAAMYAPWYLCLIVPLAGGLITGLIGLAFKVETRGAGTSGMVAAVALRSGYLSFRKTLPRVAAGIVTIEIGRAHV